MTTQQNDNADNADNGSVTFSAEQVRQMRNVLSSLPYSGLLRSPYMFMDSPDQFLSWLTGYSSMIRDEADRNTEIKVERDALLRQRDAMRKFLGTDKEA